MLSVHLETYRLGSREGRGSTLPENTALQLPWWCWAPLPQLLALEDKAEEKPLAVPSAGVRKGHLESGHIGRIYFSLMGRCGINLHSQITCLYHHSTTRTRVPREQPKELGGKWTLLHNSMIAYPLLYESPSPSQSSLTGLYLLLP